MKYIKNVTSEIEMIAYINENYVFKLHFTGKPQNLKVGETILLYQNPPLIGRCFTHLIVIINDEVFENMQNQRHQYYIYVKLISKGIHLLNNENTPHWINIPHGGYAAGNLVNISNLNSVQTSESLENKLIHEAWNLFLPINEI